MFDKSKKPSIEDKTQYKTAMTNLFLYYNQFALESVLLSEYFWSKEHSLHNVRTNFVETMTKEIINAQKNINKIFNQIINKTLTKVEDISYCPDLDEVKEEYAKERLQIKRQFSRMRRLDYQEKLNNNPNFLRKLIDFVSMVKPDCKFSIPNEIDLDNIDEGDLDGVSGDFSSDNDNEDNEPFVSMDVPDNRDYQGIWDGMNDFRDRCNDDEKFVNNMMSGQSNRDDEEDVDPEKKKIADELKDYQEKQKKMISEGKDDPVKLTTGKPVETSSMFKTNSIFTYISEGLNSIEMPLADKNCRDVCLDRFDRFLLCTDGGLYQYEFIKKDAESSSVKDFTETHQKIESDMDFFEILKLQNSLNSYYIVSKRHPIDENEDEEDIEYSIHELNTLEEEIVLQKTGLEIYYVEGKQNLKTTSNYLYFMKNYNTVTVINNPHFETSFEITDFEFEFPIYDYVMIGSDKVAAISRDGQFLTKLAGKKYEKPVDSFGISIELGQNEKISKIEIDNDHEKYLLVATEMNDKAHRLLIYEVIGYGDGSLVMIYNNEIKFGQSRLGKGLKSIAKIDLSLKEKDTYYADRVILLIEQDEESPGILVLTIDDDTFQCTEVQYLEDLFEGNYKGMCTNKDNQYWFLAGTKMHFLNRNYIMKRENRGNRHFNRITHEDSSDDDDDLMNPVQSLDYSQRGRGRMNRRGNYNYLSGISRPTRGMGMGYGEDASSEESEGTKEKKKKMQDDIEKIKEAKKAVEEREEFEKKMKEEEFEQGDDDEDSDGIANYVVTDDSGDEEGTSEDEEGSGEEVEPVKPVE